MSNEAQILPTNTEELREFATVLLSKLKHRDLKIIRLEHQLAGLRRHRFGSSSEALDQLQLSLEDSEIATSVESADQADDGDTADGTGKSKPKRKPLPNHLPRNEGPAG